MKPEELLAELSRVATELDIRVSYESLRASVGLGGLCRVKNEYRVIIEKRAGVSERAATLASALASFNLSGIKMKPAAREVVNYYAVRQAS